jgi:nucleoside triphosphatase
MMRRFIAAALLRNTKGEVLVCKMPTDNGVFPGQWGCPGGGMEDDETVEQALRREVREEVGVEITNIQSLYFWDDVRTKLRAGQEPIEVYMIYLVHLADALSEEVTLERAEFEEYRWVRPQAALELDLNAPNRRAIEQMLRDGHLEP